MMPASTMPMITATAAMSAGLPLSASTSSFAFVSSENDDGR